MKKYLLLTFMIVSGFVFGQLTINQEEGLTDFVVTNVPEKNKVKFIVNQKSGLKELLKILTL